ncbi:MAG TPA: hypothetical protein VKY85_11285 [Candidatus Angelobacter sp.]|nr:hypothetical protein [Candidatus Angelobacter sp.]
MMRQIAEKLAVTLVMAKIMSRATSSPALFYWYKNTTFNKNMHLVEHIFSFFPASYFSGTWTSKHL